MARIRSIKPEFWTSEQIADCSPIARLLFIGIWSFSDDSGVHPANIKRLKMEIFPGDDISVGEISSLVDELSRAGLLCSYEVNDAKYWRVTGWHHQKIDRPTYKHPLESGNIPNQPDRPTPSSKLSNNSRERRALMAVVVARDGHLCAYCGDEKGPFELDHIKPSSQGGSDSQENLCCACQDCNRSKGDMDAGEFIRIKGYNVADMSATLRRAITPGEEGRGEESKGEDNNITSGIGIPNCPHLAIVELYNSILGQQGLTLVRPGLWAGSSRETSLKARWREDASRQNLEFWRKFFEYVGKSDFLTGRNGGDRKWSADLGWLLERKNFIKVMEGKYHG